MTTDPLKTLNPADVLALSEIDHDPKLVGVRAFECVCGQNFQTATEFRDHLYAKGVKPDDYGYYFEHADQLRRANAEKFEAKRSAKESAKS